MDSDFLSQVFFFAVVAGAWVVGFVLGRESMTRQIPPKRTAVGCPFEDENPDDIDDADWWKEGKEPPEVKVEDTVLDD